MEDIEIVNLGYINNSLNNYEIDNKGTIYYKDEPLEYKDIFIPLEKPKLSYKIEYLLAKIFIENPYNLKIVIYKDGNYLNKSLNNLEWSSINQDSYNFLKQNQGKSSGKYCRICKSFKPYSDYYNTKNGKNSNFCKDCGNTRRNLKAEEYLKRRQSNRKSKSGLNYLNTALKYEKFKEDKEAYLKFLEKIRKYNDDNWWIGTLSQLKRRAKDLNISFNLTKEDLYVPEICPLLKIPISRKNPKKLYCVSWDRIIPELGYTKGNVRAISLKANIMKNNANFEELKCFAENIIPYMENKDFGH